MSNGGVNGGRRRFLTAASSVVGAAGAVGVAVPFVRSWNPSAKAKAAGAPVKINIGNIEPGQMVTEEWRGKPVFIRHRTVEEISEAEVVPMDVLRDPQTDEERRIKAEYLVMVGVCTHLGCIPSGQKVGEEKGEYGGWFCPCHGSHYDTSGRIRKGPAPTNLVVPPYEFIEDTVVQIG